MLNKPQCAKQISLDKYKHSHPELAEIRDLLRISTHLWIWRYSESVLTSERNTEVCVIIPSSTSSPFILFFICLYTVVTVKDICACAPRLNWYYSSLSSIRSDSTELDYLSQQTQSPDLALFHFIYTELGQTPTRHNRIKPCWNKLCWLIKFIITSIQCHLKTAVCFKLDAESNRVSSEDGISTQCA